MVHVRTEKIGSAAQPAARSVEHVFGYVEADSPYTESVELRQVPTCADTEVQSQRHLSFCPQQFDDHRPFVVMPKSLPGPTVIMRCHIPVSQHRRRL